MKLTLRRVFSLVALVTALAATGGRGTPRNLLEAIFGSTVPQVSRVVVARIDPWIDRVLGSSPHSFENGQSEGDLRAILDEPNCVYQIEDDLRGTNVISHSEGCHDATYDPQWLPVSWAILLFQGQTRVAEIYLTRDSLCASTGTHLYEVDPQGLGLDLKRQFSFMNF
jgi:hypothetical protein